MIKKLIPVLVLLFLSGCTFPSSRQPTANPATVEEIVAMTLTAEAAIAPVENTPTAVLSSPTIEFSTETPVSPASPLPAKAATETAAITVVTAGFRNTLGSPNWKDPLDNGLAFGLDETGYQDDNTKIAITNGTMVLSSSSIYGYRGWRLTSKSPTNVYLEAKFIVNSCSDDDLYGLVYRAPDYDSGLGYYLGITCEGKYTVSKWTASGSSTIISSAANPAILSGPNQTNRIGIQMVGSEFFIHINDSLITQFSDDAFKEGGHFGVFIAGQGNGNLQVSMDEIAYWNLD